MPVLLSTVKVWLRAGHVVLLLAPAASCPRDARRRCELLATRCLTPMTASLMPTTVLDVVDAYRTDLVNATRPNAFGERDDVWLLCGTILYRALALPAD